MGDLPWSPGYRKTKVEVKAGLTAADVAAGVAAFAMTAADADMRSRRPRCHRQQQLHKRHTAELRIDVGVLRRKRPQGWELRGQHALVLQTPRCEHGKGCAR